MDYSIKRKTNLYYKILKQNVFNVVFLFKTSYDIMQNGFDTSICITQGLKTNIIAVKSGKRKTIF